MMAVRLAAFAALIFLSLVQCGCGDSGEATRAKAGPRTVVDMAGRSVALPEKVERIGTLGSVGVLNTFVELMGEGRKICNEMPAGFRSGRWNMHYEFAPQIAGGPVFESNRELRIETIMMAKTDVCFTMSLETAAALERHGIACVYLKWAELDDVKTALSLMGDVLDRKDVAELYIKYFDEKLAQAKALTARLPASRRLRVLYGNPAQLSQPHQIAEWWIETAGGISVTRGYNAGTSVKYTLEDLLHWDPEVMILSGAKAAEEMLGNDNYLGITAVKNRAFHFMPTVAHTWGNRTVEQPLTVLWTIHKLYPDLLSRDELAGEIKYFYSTFFLYDLTERQIDEIIGSNADD